MLTHSGKVVSKGILTNWRVRSILALPNFALRTRQEVHARIRLRCVWGRYNGIGSSTGHDCGGHVHVSGGGSVGSTTVSLQALNLTLLMICIRLTTVLDPHTTVSVRDSVNKSTIVEPVGSANDSPGLLVLLVWF
jgi:hypothetical protein